MAGVFCTFVGLDSCYNVFPAGKFRIQAPLSIIIILYWNCWNNADDALSNIHVLVTCVWTVRASHVAVLISCFWWLV